jgi:uncharacterized repeat protein (TIGR03803 family)
MAFSRTLSSILTALGLAMVLTTSSSAQTFTDLFDFDGANGGTTAYAVLAQGRDGQLYGTTIGGGSNDYGVVFRINTQGTESVIYSFDGTYGNAPAGGLTLGTDGNFYGTTQTGGSNDFGVLFRITPSGSLTVLHNFTGIEDSYPDAAPIEAADGNFYGTAVGETYGEVYEYSPNGTYTVTHTFSDTDGRSPIAALMQAANGNLYGTTYEGGEYGWGTAFEMTTAGAILAEYSFNFSTTGGYPAWPVLQGSDSNFYSTTSMYAGNPYTGSVFKLGPEFAYSVLYTPPDNPTQIGELYSGVMQATDGNLYVLGQTGGPNNYGGILQLGLDGTATAVYGFSTYTLVEAGMMQHTDGKLYGSVQYATTDGDGYLFSLDMGLRPFVTFVQPSGRAGQTAQILGQGLNGTTSVTFNGVPATSFSVVRNTFLTAVIPDGATTGKVVVTTPSSVFTSNVNFWILQ